MQIPPDGNSSHIEQLLCSLRSLTRAMELHSKQLVKTANVTGPQLRLLKLIYSQPNTSLRELSNAMSLSQATVTSIMDRLEKRELIARVRSELDKRKIFPQLTPHGQAIVDRAPAQMQDSFIQKFGELQTWEQHMIISSLQRVAEMMNAPAQLAHGETITDTKLVAQSNMPKRNDAITESEFQ